MNYLYLICSNILLCFSMDSIPVGMVKALTGGYVITYHPNATDPDNLGEPLTVDFTPPFKRLQMVPDLEKLLNTKLPDPSEFGTPGNNNNYYNYCWG